ncbi:MAG: hypothetical protein WCE62_04435 [Polyangiales bacterium]
MKHVCIALVAMIAALFSTGRVAAQYEYGPEEEGAEESPIVDPDTEADDSNAELEKIEAMDKTEGKAAAEDDEPDRKGRGCALDRSRSTPSQAPIEALLIAVGLIAYRKLRATP